MRSFVFGKPVVAVALFFSLLFLGGCSVNPATGEQQFTALMPPDQERAIGAKQHEEIVKQYGGIYPDKSLQNYVSDVGKRVAKNTERKDISYRFTLLDSPVINAFALPGGYVYITRGLLAVANDEAELAAVLGHEIGHVTGRHQAERYSQGIVAALGATIVSAAIGDPGVTDALSLGNDLYMSAYSRDQEHEADKLGVRYLHRAGYDPLAMSDFLGAMKGYLDTEGRVSGKDEEPFTYFSSHPDTAERAGNSARESLIYPPAAGGRNREAYLSALRGMTYGESADQGFVSGEKFVHPRLGFAFSVPRGFEIINQPEQVVAAGGRGELLIFDMDRKPQGQGMMEYIMDGWLEGERGTMPEPLSINGMEAATTTFGASVNGRPVTIRLVAVAWAPDRVFRFQFAIPQGTPASVVEAMKRTTYSFRRLGAEERQQARERRIDIVTARAGDTDETMARRMAVEKGALPRFRALNALGPRDSVQAGKSYKVVTGG